MNADTRTHTGKRRNTKTTWYCYTGVSRWRQLLLLVQPVALPAFLHTLRVSIYLYTVVIVAPPISWSKLHTRWGEGGRGWNATWRITKRRQLLTGRNSSKTNKSARDRRHRWKRETDRYADGLQHLQLTAPMGGWGKSRRHNSSSATTAGTDSSYQQTGGQSTVS